MKAGGVRVLYVDDEDLWRCTVSDYLPLLGSFSITTTESGESALELLSRESFDIIISDFQMPEMDGITLLVRIREFDSTTPFILFTGLTLDEVCKAAEENGADYFITKQGEPDLVFSGLSERILQAIEDRKE